MNQTQKAANNWVNTCVAELGLQKTINLLTYNIKHNQYFSESNDWITYAWQRLSELNHS